MNKGQEMFLNYILERVQEDQVEEVKALLMETFKKQNEGTFTKEDMNQFIPKMTSLLKQDKVEEVKKIMEEFASNFD